MLLNFALHECNAGRIRINYVLLLFVLKYGFVLKILNCLKILNKIVFKPSSYFDKIIANLTCIQYLFVQNQIITWLN